MSPFGFSAFKSTGNERDAGSLITRSAVNGGPNRCPVQSAFAEQVQKKLSEICRDEAAAAVQKKASAAA
jgi:hypothetical protein